MVDDNTCNYCKRTFKRLSTLEVHFCEPKRRFLQRQDQNVVMGYRMFILWYKIAIFEEVCRRPISLHPGLGRSLCRV